MMISPHAENQRLGGFTLLEMAIVISIIALLIGGIYAGKQLVYTAKIDAQVAQIQRFDAAASTFKLKYGYLPGDIPNPSAVGLYQPATAAYVGNGDGFITDHVGVARIGAATASYYYTGEITLFWRHLSQAGLIDGNYTDDGMGTVAGVPGVAFPMSKMYKNWGIVVMSYDTYGNGAGQSNNYFYLGALASPGAPYGAYSGTSAGNHYFGSSILSPLDALLIDQKIDDGMPLTGTVQARYGYYNVTANIVASTVGTTSGCITTDTPSTSQYAITNTTERDCSLEIDASF